MASAIKFINKVSSIRKANLRYIPPTSNLCHSATHQFKDLTGEHFINCHSVSQLTIHSCTKSENTSISGQGSCMVHSTGHETYSEVSDTLQLDWIGSIFSITDPKLSKTVPSPSIHTSGTGNCKTVVSSTCNKWYGNSKKASRFYGLNFTKPRLAYAQLTMSVGTPCEQFSNCRKR